MLKLMLTDELWSKLRTIMRQHGIYNKPNLRKIVEGILYRMRVGCPWRDLPSKFGCWSSVYQQFNRWSSKNKVKRFEPWPEKKEPHQLFQEKVGAVDN